MTQSIQIVLLYENERQFNRNFAKLSKIEPTLIKALKQFGQWHSLKGFNTPTVLGLGTDTLHVTIERFDQPMDMKGFVDVLANPLNQSIKATLAKSVVEHKRAILVQVCTGSVPGFGNMLKEFGLADQLGIADDPKMGMCETQAEFENRLLIAQALGIALINEVNPTAVHWCQSHQIFDGAAFSQLASDGFSLPLYTGPFLCDVEQMPDGEVKAGIRAFGSQNLLGKMVTFKSDVQPWSDSYMQILGFIAYCRSIGRILEDHETMASDAPGAPVIRVKHRNDIPQLPEGYVELSVDRRGKNERPPVLETYEAEQAKVFAAMRGERSDMGTAKRSPKQPSNSKPPQASKRTSLSIPRASDLLGDTFNRVKPKLMTLAAIGGVFYLSEAGGIIDILNLLGLSGTQEALLGSGMKTAPIQN